MSANRKAEPRTLKEAHEAVTRLRPRLDAPLSAWLVFRRTSAAVYEAVADVDRGHHHEALYWVGTERKAADQIAVQIDAEKAARMSQQGKADTRVS